MEVLVKEPTKVVSGVVFFLTVFKKNNRRMLLNEEGIRQPWMIGTSVDRFLSVFYNNNMRIKFSLYYVSVSTKRVLLNIFTIYGFCRLFYLLQALYGEFQMW